MTKPTHHLPDNENGEENSQSRKPTTDLIPYYYILSVVSLIVFLTV